MSEHDPAICKVLTLDEFRDKVGEDLRQSQSHSDTLERLNYEFATFPEYAIYRHVVEHIEPNSAQNNLIIAIRETDRQETPYIFIAKDDADRYLAIDRGEDEVESLTLDFCTYDPEEPDYSDELIVFYTAALIGKAMLNGGKRIDFNQAYQKLEMPVIGDAKVNLDFDDRFIEITKWRAAGGIALHAVTGKNSILQDRLEGHLRNQLSYRMHYDQGRQQFANLLGINTDDECSISDRMLGICNPLSRMALRTAMSSADTSSRWFPLI